MRTILICRVKVRFQEENGGWRGLFCASSFQIHSCRIPDDYIDENRYPLFMARTVMTELMASLQASGRAQT